MIWLWPIAVLAADFYLDAQTIEGGPTILGAQVVDIDADGVDDIISADSQTGMYIWDGPVNRPSTLTGPVAPYHVADFDNDGQVELLDANTLYEIPGLTVSGGPYATDPRGNIADLNNDQLPDFVLGDMWWENRNNATSFLDGTLPSVSADARHCFGVFVDDDAFPDLVCDDYVDKEITWYAGNGTGFSWTRHSVYLDMWDIELHPPADANNDGEIDLLVSVQTKDGSTLVPTLLLIPGGPSPNEFGAPVVVQDPVSGTPSVGFLSGQPHIAANCAVYPVSGTIIGTPIPNPTCANEPLWLDWDGDGDADEIFNGYDGVAFNLEDPAPEGTALQVRLRALDGAVDLDGNGGVDVCMGSRFLHRENALGTSWRVTYGPAGHNGVWGDFDGNGDPDRLDGERLAVRDPVSKAWSVTELFDPPTAVHQSVGIDLDDNGLMDVVTHQDTGIWAWIGTGSSFTPRQIATRQSNRIAIGDFDDDGDLDVASLTGNTLYWYDNRDGAGTVWDERTAVTSGCGTSSGLVVFDAELDGDDDLLMYGSTCTDRLVPQTASGFTGSHTLNLGSFVEIADVDLDGDLDLLTEQSDRLVLLERQSAATDDFITRSLGSDVISDAQLADIDGDGDIDIVTWANGRDVIEFWRNNTNVPATDLDGDGVEASVDVCPDNWDPDQADSDGDGAGDTCDCAPSDATVSPMAVEVCDAVDQNCDGTIDNGFDVDGDGHTTCGPDGVPSTTDDDCDDTDATINPGAAEVANDNIDNDCDPSTVDDDLDGDGYDTTADCDDTEPLVNPGQTEVPYDSVDNDCNAATRDDDLDQDGFDLASDCDDANSAVNPSATEVPYDGVDNDCDGGTPDDDLDGDGHNRVTDCDDNNAGVYPGRPELPYDGVDNDCNPNTPDDDVDRDGFGVGEDCDDDEAAAYPGADEIPADGIDNDCDPDTVDGLAPVTRGVGREEPAPFEPLQPPECGCGFTATPAPAGWVVAWVVALRRQR